MDKIIKKLLNIFDNDMQNDIINLSIKNGVYTKKDIIKWKKMYERNNKKT